MCCEHCCSTGQGTVFQCVQQIFCSSDENGGQQRTHRSPEPLSLSRPPDPLHCRRHRIAADGYGEDRDGWRVEGRKIRASASGRSLAGDRAAHIGGRPQLSSWKRSSSKMPFTQDSLNSSGRYIKNISSFACWSPSFARSNRSLKFTLHPSL